MMADRPGKVGEAVGRGMGDAVGWCGGGSPARATTEEDGMAVRTEELGTASLGFPFNGAALSGSRLVVSSRNLVPARLAVYDLDTGEVRDGPEVPTGNGAWGLAAVGSTVFLGQAGTADGETVLYRYDLDADALSPVAPLDADYVWVLDASASGFVYGAAGGRDQVVQYDPRDGQLRDLGIAQPGDGLRALAVSGGSLVYGGRRDGAAFLRESRVGAFSEQREILPPELADHEFAYDVDAGPGAVAVGTQGPGSSAPAVAILSADGLGVERVVTLPAGDSLVDTVAVAEDAVYATARPRGALYRISRSSGELTELAVPVPGAETRELFVRGGEVVGVSAAERVWRWDVAGGSLSLVDLLSEGLTPGAEQGQSISAGGGTVAVGGNFGVQVRRVVDRETLRRPTPGEPKDQVVVGTERFLACYPTAQVLAGGLGLDDPLGVRVQLPPEQNRTVALHHDVATDLVCCGTASDARGGGALHVFAPSGDGLATYVDVVARDQFVSRIASADGLAFLAGGSGDPGLVAFDLRTRAEVWRIAPLGTALGTVTGLVPLGGRLHVLTQEGWYVVVDLAARSVVSVTRIGSSGGRMFAYGDRLTAVDRDALFDIDPATGARTDVVTDLAPFVFGNPFLAIDEQQARYVIRGTDLLRLAEE